MAEHNLEKARVRYQYACGYCGVTETSSGGLLTLDHYKPRMMGGDDSGVNLIYACFKCNQYKWEFWPDEKHLARHHRVLHPLLDDLSQHIRENEQIGFLEPLTETGKFHIALLKLNRPQLIKNRLSRMMLRMFQEKQKLLEQQLNELEKTIEAQNQYLAFLEDQLKKLK